MLERRRTVRPEPIGGADDEIIQVGDIPTLGVVGNISQGGICAVLPRTADFKVGQELTVVFRGRTARAQVRNVTYHMLTAAYDLEWTPPLTSEEPLHGARVRISAGVLQGVEGTIVLQRADGRVVVQLPNGVNVEIDSSCVRKVLEE
jgi:hypothetical protein